MLLQPVDVVKAQTTLTATVQLRIMDLHVVFQSRASTEHGTALGARNISLHRDGTLDVWLGRYDAFDATKLLRKLYVVSFVVLLQVLKTFERATAFRAPVSTVVVVEYNVTLETFK